MALQASNPGVTKVVGAPITETFRGIFFFEDTAITYVSGGNTITKTFPAGYTLPSQVDDITALTVDVLVWVIEPNTGA